MFRFIATPLFLVLAAFNYQEAVYLCVIPGPLGFMGTMWFMYLVMAVVHIDGWVEWLRGMMQPVSKQE